MSLVRAQQRGAEMRKVAALEQRLADADAELAKRGERLDELERQLAAVQAEQVKRAKPSSCGCALATCRLLDVGRVFAREDDDQ